MIQVSFSTKNFPIKLNQFLISWLGEVICETSYDIDTIISRVDIWSVIQKLEESCPHKQAGKHY